MTLRDVLRKNFADSNAENGLQGNLLFCVEPLTDSAMETSNFWLEGGETNENSEETAPTIETAEDLILLSGGEWTFPLDDEVKIIDDDMAIRFPISKTEMKISKIGYVKLS